MEFSGGKTAAHQVTRNQHQKPQLASTFHRCPQEGFFFCRAYSSQLSLKKFFENILKFFKFRQLTHITIPVLLLPLFHGFQKSTLLDMHGQKY